MTHVTKSSSFSELEARSTVALDSGDGGTRRSCNNENCSQNYGHKGPCDRPDATVPASLESLTEDAQEYVRGYNDGFHNAEIYHAHLNQSGSSLDFDLELAHKIKANVTTGT